MPRSAEWSEDDRRQVASWLLSGQSLAGVARMLGVTRGTVIGRVHRDVTLSIYAGKAMVKMEHDRHPDRDHLECVEVFPRASPALAWTPEPGGVVLLMLTRTSCKWPVRETEQGHLFCGADCKPGRVYCERHHGRAHG